MAVQGAANRMDSDPDSPIRLHQISGSVEVVDALPRPQWPVIDAWIDSHVELDGRDAARDSAARQWLKRLADYLGEPYWVAETEHFVVLTSQNAEDADQFLRLGHNLLSTIRRILDRLIVAEPYRQWYVLLFADVEAWFTYVHHFYAEGEYGASAACHISKDFPHIVLTQGWSTGRAMAHELTHANLHPLGLPLWTEEGIAQIVEQITTAQPAIMLDQERAAQHKAYWRQHGLQCFWSGEAFSQADCGRELAYELAEILTRNIMADHRAGFLEFLQSATFEDAGEQAARDCLGMSLTDCAATFLGQGDWMPRSEEAPDKV